MSNRPLCFVVALATFACVGTRTASAQRPWFWATSIGASNYGHGYGYPTAGGYDPVSGSRMAAAEMIRAYGQASAMTTAAQSQALINYEQARGQYIENADRWTDVYNKRRRESLALEASERERNREDLQRYLQNRPGSAPPQTLSPGQLNPSTGDIEWPANLRGEEYASLRDAIEREFETLAAASGAAGNDRRIRELADRMRGVLRANIRKMPSYEYIAARKFIDGLANSAVTY